MGLCTSGVSGGVAVSNQAGGVSLTAAGDYATIFINNQAAPGGPDTSGLFALSGSFVAANITVQFVADVTNFNSANWQPLQNVLRNDTQAAVSGAFVPTSATALQLNPGYVQNLYAIRVILNSITSGTLLCNGFTTPGSVAGVEAAILSQLTVSNNLNKAIALANYDATGNDYYSALGGIW